MITILPVCNDFAPDTFAPDEGDGTNPALVCSSCFWHKDDHKERG